MPWGFIAEDLSIILRRATGQIDDLEELRLRLALLKRMRRHAAILGVIATAMPIIVIVGLALLAWKLRTLVLSQFEF